MPIADQRKVLMIQARNLGDAVISTALIETINCGLPAAKIDVLTRPEISRIFAGNPHVDEIVTARFPMGSLGDFSFKEAWRLSRLVYVLRRRRYTDVINIEGDFREELLGLLITRKNNWSPVWSVDHPRRRTIRPSKVRLANRLIPIASNTPNVHEATAMFGTAISHVAARKPALYMPGGQKIAWNPARRAVGIHPMASQPWRRWELEKWVSVSKALIECGLEVHVFGSPSESEELTRHFGQLDASKITIVTGGLSDYFSSVSKMRVLLCPDSFASHVAYALGVPTILLNGANDAAAWAPPGTLVLAAGPELKCYPCYNRPTCFGSADEFACVRRIERTSVLETVWKVLNGTTNSNVPCSAQRV